jgi:hypothetical protein
MEQVIAAIISAVASVIVALLSKSSATSEARSAFVGDQAKDKLGFSSTAKKRWMIVLALLVPWLLLSPPLIHWDIVGLNMFVILAVTLVVSFAWPIKPLAAVAIVLILHPISFVMEPIAKGLRGMNPNGRLEQSKIVFLVSIFLGNAIVAGILCAWRGRAKTAQSEIGRPVEVAADKQQRVDSLANELDKLGNLRAQGVISEDEFQKAKLKVLNR